MDENRLLDNEQLGKVSGGQYIVKDKGYNLYQIAWLYAEEALDKHSNLPKEKERIRVYWAKFNEELIEAGHETVTMQEFIDEVDKAWKDLTFGYWPPFD